MTPSLAQCVRADRSFEHIYRRHVGDVYRYSLAVLRQPADAEHVTQTTFLNACRAFERGERPSNAQNWLIAIAHGVCRQRSLRATPHVDEVMPGWNPREDEWGPTADDVQRALGRLAFEQRAALAMRELEGRSYAQIAEILGLPRSAVETLLFEARRALREQLEGLLTCTEAERAISRRADIRLPRAERAALRTHLRECPECARFAGAERAQRNAFKALAEVEVPVSLTSLFGGDGAVAAGLPLKAGAAVAAGLLATGVGHAAPKRADSSRVEPSAAAQFSVSQRQARPAEPGNARRAGLRAAVRPERKIFPAAASLWKDVPSSPPGAMPPAGPGSLFLP
jgi:RNA polymerase sigma-70 factor (ECF subfamily)